MCGIAGIIAADLTPDQRRERVERMLGALRHRGPDDGGVVTSGPATLGMRRLAVIDPEGGRQPMGSADGNHQLVFNGAIYNFRSLRRDMEEARSFRTRSDTEVLLAALENGGEAALPQLRGMYALAFWDERDQKLLLARDPFGIKPLYLHAADGRLFFASELRALTASGLIERAIDPVALSHYLSFLSVPAPRTLLRGVSSLLPGECASFQHEKLSRRLYWTVPPADPSDKPARDYGALVGGLRERLEESVRAHLIADVPVGAFLSGGIDSAAVVAFARRHHAGPLKTFSLGFSEPRYSEAAEARATAEALGTEHREYLVSGAEVAGEIEEIISAMDQPTGEGVNTWYASRLARQGGVTVALSGLGGDELFGGYPSFRDLPRLARWLPGWLLLPAVVRSAIVGRLRRGDQRQQKLGFLLESSRDLTTLAARYRTVFTPEQKRGLLAPDVVPEQPSFHPALERLSQETHGLSAARAISHWEMRTYMADTLLRDSDAMSMQHSLELRVPWVDQALLRWWWHQPQALRRGAAEPKQVLADACRGVVPEAVLTRPKRGFTLPFPLWMKGELKPFLEETFAEANTARSGFFQPDSVQALWQQFLKGNDDRQWSRVWSLAVLLRWI